MKILVVEDEKFDILLFLITNKGRVLAKETIAEHVWGDNIDMTINYNFIYSQIKNIRKKIELNGGRDYFQTVYGTGYKFTDK